MEINEKSNKKPTRGADMAESGYADAQTL